MIGLLKAVRDAVEAVDAAAKALVAAAEQLGQQVKSTEAYITDLDSKRDRLRTIESETALRTEELTKLNGAVESARTLLAQIKASIPV